MALLSDGNDPSRFPREKGCLGEYSGGIIIGTTVGMRISFREYSVLIPSTSPLKKRQAGTAKSTWNCGPEAHMPQGTIPQNPGGLVVGLSLLPGHSGSIRKFRDSSPESRDRTEKTGRSGFHPTLLPGHT